MRMYWLECITAIVGKVQWNTFVLSATINHLAYFGTAAPKYGVFCVFNQIIFKSTHHRYYGCQIVLDLTIALYDLELSVARYPGNL
jgi:hypothetical protein